MGINLQPTVCNICGGKVIYCSNTRVYGKEYGSGWCYLCTECNARTGTHKPRPKEALGILADEAMRKGKTMCHELFDVMWQGLPNAKKKRGAAYKWLAERLEIDVQDCHFGHFDLEMLRKAYRILRDHPQQREAQEDEHGKEVV